MSFFKNLRDCCKKKKLERFEEPKNLTTWGGNSHAVTISMHEPVPSLSAAANATSGFVPITDRLAS